MLKNEEMISGSISDVVAALNDSVANHELTSKALVKTPIGEKEGNCFVFEDTNYAVRPVHSRNNGKSEWGVRVVLANNGGPLSLGSLRGYVDINNVCNETVATVHCDRNYESIDQAIEKLHQATKTFHNDKKGISFGRTVTMDGTHARIKYFTAGTL
ncbi:MAG: hypothetical protein GY861_08600 [bacterium]|nr:hypothetical protein [bacterium]